MKKLLIALLLFSCTGFSKHLTIESGFYLKDTLELVKDYSNEGLSTYRLYFDYKEYKESPTTFLSDCKIVKTEYVYDYLTSIIEETYKDKNYFEDNEKTTLYKNSLKEWRKILNNKSFIECVKNEPSIYVLTKKTWFISKNYTLFLNEGFED